MSNSGGPHKAAEQVLKVVAVISTWRAHFASIGCRPAIWAVSPIACMARSCCDSARGLRRHPVSVDATQTRADKPVSQGLLLELEVIELVLVALRQIDIAAKIVLALVATQRLHGHLRGRACYYFHSGRPLISLGWLMGLEPYFAKNLWKPAPALTFAFSSRLKNW